MSDTHKVILIVSALVIVAVLAALKVIGGDVTGAAILSVIAFVTGQVIHSKLGGGGAAKAILFVVVVTGLSACAGWQTQAKTTGQQLQQCLARAAQQCAVEAASQLKLGG